MKNTFCLTLLIVIFFHMPVFTEDSDIFAIVLYAEGYEVSIYQNDGTVEVFDVLNDDFIGQPLYEGESIETDSESYVEIQLYPSENILKLSESTALTLDSMYGSSGGSELSLVYGSVRAKVEKLLTDDPFSIQTGNTIAGVRGTDFGVDYVYDDDEETYVTDVICFEGEIEVRETEETESSERYSIGPDEQLTVRPRPDGLLGFSRLPLADMRKEFWEKRDFREAPVLPGIIEKRFPGLLERIKSDEEFRRMTPEQRMLPGFKGVIPQRPLAGQLRERVQSARDRVNERVRERTNQEQRPPDPNNKDSESRP